MASLIARLDEALYPHVQDNWDDRQFREIVLRHLAGSPKDVLDLGAGAGILPQMNFRDVARRMCGVDPDPRVRDNPYLNEGLEGMGENIPYGDGSFDVVIANNVLEHLPEPALVLAEIRRVLRPGGVFLAKTPNRWHYVPLVASLTPHSFHQWINERRGRSTDDTFPTHYRANTPPAIRRLAKRTGFSSSRITLTESRPEYLRGNAATYVVGWAYERAVNTLPFLARFRVVMFCEVFV